MLVAQFARREGKRVCVTGMGQSPSDLPYADEFIPRTISLNKVLD